MTEETQLLCQAEAHRAQVQRRMELMRAANRVIRLNGAGGASAQIAALESLGYTHAQAGALVQPDFNGAIGFTEKALERHAAELARLDQWIEHQDATTKEST